MSGIVIRSVVEFTLRRLAADRRRPDMVLGPACPVIVLPVIKIERHPGDDGVIQVRRGRRIKLDEGIWHDG